MKTISADKKVAKKMFRSNLRAARFVWGEVPTLGLQILRELTYEYGLSVPLGDLQLLSSKWYVTHSGLLRIARRCKCSAIKTLLVPDYSDSASSRWVFKATVYPSIRSKGYVGYGDADPSNVSQLVTGAESVSPKRARSIVLFEKPTASAFALSKSLVGNRSPMADPISPNQPLPQATMVIRTVTFVSAIACAS